LRRVKFSINRLALLRHRTAFHAGINPLRFNAPERGPKELNPVLSAGLFLFGAGAVFGQGAYRLPTSPPKKKGSLLFS
jgi:hypothetical protein